MGEKTGNRKYLDKNRKLADYYLKVRFRSSKAKRMAKYALKSGDITINEMGEPREIEQFKTELEDFVECYIPKKKYLSDNKEELKESIPDNPELDNYSFDDLKKLHYNLVEMQEELGHTTIENREYKKRDIGRD